jgi:FKBP-type peptidyl-prolyl cis-trans isomerase SlyD
VSQVQLLRGVIVKRRRIVRTMVHLRHRGSMNAGRYNNQLAAGKPSMNIFRNTVVTLSFRLYDSSNKLIEETDEPIAYLHGGHSGIFPKVEAALKDKKVGDNVSVTLEPDDAFGDYDTDLMRIEALDQLPPDVSIGGQLVAEQDGNEVVWRITDIADGKAVLDGNHELAGQRLRFDCTVLDVRPATQEEITHGHVHGAHGHHH